MAFGYCISAKKLATNLSPNKMSIIKEFGPLSYERECILYHIHSLNKKRKFNLMSVHKWPTLIDIL